MSEKKTSSKECAICLETLIYPCELPCGHIFCFLCIKGLIQTQSSKCALCRTDIPVNVLESPQLVNLNESGIKVEPSDDDFYVWYYEGRNGWWEYDDRTNFEIENQFNRDPNNKFEILIAGFLYIIDFESGYQMRLDNANKKRRIKRDFKNINANKGVAGISKSINPRPVH